VHSYKKNNDRILIADNGQHYKSDINQIYIYIYLNSSSPSWCR